MQAGRNTCRMMTFDSGRPLARAVRTYGAFSESSMEPRVMRAMAAMEGSASAHTGRTMCANWPLFQPEIGNQPRYRPKNSVSSGAVTKVGMATPVMAIAMTVKSTAVFLRKAATMPPSIPKNSPTAMAVSPSCALTGRPSAISSATFLSR